LEEVEQHAFRLQEDAGGAVERAEDRVGRDFGPVADARPEASAAPVRFEDEGHERQAARDHLATGAQLGAAVFAADHGSRSRVAAARGFGDESFPAEVFGACQPHEPAQGFGIERTPANPLAKRTDRSYRLFRHRNAPRFRVRGDQQLLPSAFRQRLNAAMTLDDFNLAVASEIHPPRGLAVALQALWWEAKGDWHKAHLLVQNDSSGNCAWVHAFLHRKEGDETNAAYWYAKAKRPLAHGSFAAERDRIAAVLLADDLAGV
jgi:hypothetical protein